MEVKNKIFRVLLIILLSLFITCNTFVYAIGVLDLKYISSYILNPLVLILNLLPVLILFTICYLISKRIYISYFITATLTMLISIVNYKKITLRGDTFIFEDIVLWREAILMGKSYDYSLPIIYLLLLVIMILIGIVLWKYVKKGTLSFKVRMPLIVILIISSIFIYKYIYLNDNIYNNIIENEDNKWVAVELYKERGIIYPFIYSSKDYVNIKPDNYNEKEAKKVIDEYSYNKIPEDKKVNIIAIMLEAYDDFSNYNISFNEDIYANYHYLQQQSISGNLVVDIFGGGTIDTERSFLTGFTNLPNFRIETNSYVQYLKKEGYKTEFFHPITGNFYNRNIVSQNIGFDKFCNYENTFSKYELGDYNYNEYMMDSDFFDVILTKYEENKNKPYFGFAVTYQNHGPYIEDENYYNSYLVEDKGYSSETLNILNNYFYGINETNKALTKLINNIEKIDEPTIVIVFGDHKPALGDNNSVYDELGINIDLNTLEGYLNYYTTEYLIYANNSAKEMYNKDFISNGKTISPIFLMNELFDYIEIPGNEYMQYMSSYKKDIDVIGNGYIKYKDNYYLKKDNYINEIKQLEDVSYYWVSKPVTK